jgi:hypothetical protein
VDISQRYLDPFVGRDIHSCNSGHAVVSSRTANVLKSKLELPNRNTTTPTADRLYPRGSVSPSFNGAGLM